MTFGIWILDSGAGGIGHIGRMEDGPSVGVGTGEVATETQERAGAKWGSAAGGGECREMPRMAGGPA